MNNVFSPSAPRWLGPITIANAVATGILLLFFLIGFSGTAASSSSASKGQTSTTPSGSTTQSGVSSLPKQVGGC